MRFSYPGYNEILSGFPDPRIDSNDRKPNPNVTVLEWLNGRPGFSGKVAAFASWELLPWIVNTERSHIPANGDGPPITDPKTERFPSTSTAKTTVADTELIFTTVEHLDSENAPLDLDREPSQ